MEFKDFLGLAVFIMLCFAFYSMYVSNKAMKLANDVNRQAILYYTRENERADKEPAFTIEVENSLNEHEARILAALRRAGVERQPYIAQRVEYIVDEMISPAGDGKYTKI